MSSTARSYGAPAPPPPRRRRGGVVGPLLLIFLGGLLLLQNTGYLPPNFWQNVWRLWPVVLVLAGIELLLAHRVPWIVLAVLTVVVLVVGALATNAGLSHFSRPVSTTRTVQTDIGTATQAAVTIHFGAGQLDLGALAPPVPGKLAVMTYDGPAEVSPQPRYATGLGGTGVLEYQSDGRGPTMPFVGDSSGTPSMRISLSPSVPITSLTVQTGATDARLDLSGLLVNNVDMSVGAASTWLRLPQIAGTSTVHISGGAATISIEVPAGVAASIQHRGGLSTMTVDTARFAQVGEGLYRSPDYETATSKVDVSLETGVTSIQVR
ncbi:MAG TPA: DUF5668 domain-containing protein [Chloroflexota bacterium]|nr:DUF5668 domain-containing protein [Chloroflexota bacterium]